MGPGLGHINGWVCHRTETTHQFQLDIEFGQLKCLFICVTDGVCFCYTQLIDSQIEKRTDRQTDRKTHV